MLELLKFVFYYSKNMMTINSFVAAAAMALPMHPYQMGVSAQGPGSVPGPGMSPGQGMPPAYQPIVGQQQPPVPPHQPQPMTSPKKDFNALSLCRLGQEAVQEIVQKVFEIFNVLQSTKGVLVSNLLHLLIDISGRN